MNALPPFVQVLQGYSPNIICKLFSTKSKRRPYVEHNYLIISLSLSREKPVKYTQTNKQAGNQESKSSHTNTERIPIPIPIPINQSINFNRYRNWISRLNRTERNGGKWSRMERDRKSKNVMLLRKVQGPSISSCCRITVELNSHPP